MNDYLTHTVQDGECIESIAFEYGFFWETIWDDSKNGQLKSKRKDPNILMTGDAVEIPPKREKNESCPTDAKYRFRRKGVPTKVSFTIKQQGKPVANTPYIGVVDGCAVSGTTDANGNVEFAIPPNARLVKLTVGEGDDRWALDFRLGGLDPIDSISGVQARLDNLGYSTAGDETGVLGSNTKTAITKFQIDNGLKDSGELDEILCNKLKEAFAC